MEDTCRFGESRARCGYVILRHRENTSTKRGRGSTVKEMEELHIVQSQNKRTSSHWKAENKERGTGRYDERGRVLEGMNGSKCGGIILSFIATKMMYKMRLKYKVSLSVRPTCCICCIPRFEKHDVREKEREL
jgi:hypothetical protein